MLIPKYLTPSGVQLKGYEASIVCVGIIKFCPILSFWARKKKKVPFDTVVCLLRVQCKEQRGVPTSVKMVYYIQESPYIVSRIPPLYKTCLIWINSFR